jgi:hypothetical protein
MNKFLKSAVNRYNEVFKKENLINPISEVDAEIITEIYELAKKANLKGLKEILEEYKYRKDSEIRDQLLEFNTNFKGLFVKDILGIVKGEVDDKSPVPIIKIGEEYLRIWHILAWSVFEEFDDKIGDYIYGILLNPMPEGVDLKKIPMYANMKFYFNSEEDRNIVIENLLKLYKDSGEIGFLDLNKEDE